MHRAEADRLVELLLAAVKLHRGLLGRGLQRVVAGRIVEPRHVVVARRGRGRHLLETHRTAKVPVAPKLAVIGRGHERVGAIRRVGQGGRVRSAGSVGHRVPEARGQEEFRRFAAERQLRLLG